MGEEAHQFIARYASQYITGASFAEVGDALQERGFDMTQAQANEHGVLIVPHTKDGRAEAKVFRELPVVEPVTPEDKVDTPPSPDVVAAVLAGDAVLAGVRNGARLICRACGAIHPEGVLCTIPILYEMRCCLEQLYPHDGPHEALDPDGIVTHRWIEEMVITDLPFNAYGAFDMEDADE